MIDGDTIEVDLDGVSVDIRLLGINAPEMDECWGQESKAFLTSLVGNQEVLLVERPDGSDDVDAFGRLLRYVYLDSGPSPTFVNAVVVETGHAVGLQDGSENAATFKAFEARAFQSGYGMWGTFACGDREGTAEDRPVIRVSELQFDPEGPTLMHFQMNTSPSSTRATTKCRSQDGRSGMNRQAIASPSMPGSCLMSATLSPS